MSEQGTFESVKRAIIEGDGQRLAQLVQEIIDTADPLELIEKGMMPGMTEVGNKFSRGEVYLPELLMAAEAWEDAMKVIHPRLLASGATMKTQGTVVIGTVQEDIHEIGKSIVANLLTTNGFRVYDIGSDAPAAKFLDKAEEVGADIVAASAIMSTTVPRQRDVIDLLEAKGIRDKYLVMVGGGVVTQEWADKIGADGYGELASDAVEVAKKLVAERKER